VYFLMCLSLSYLVRKVQARVQIIR
jgi:hypothetical protein